jgi:periplasmic copper chaperone A
MRVKTKLGLLVAVAAVVTVLLAAPASAHEQIDPSSFPVGKPTFLTLRAANEEQSDLTKIVLTAPKDLPFGEATQEPAGWTVNRTEEEITYTGGAVKPEAFAEWGFEIEGADQPGTYDYTVTMTFADGKTDDVKVPVTAVAAGATGAAKSSSSGASSSSVDSAKSRSSAALAIGIVAIVLAIVAIVLVVTRRRGKGSAAPATGGDAKQDW